MNYRGQINKLKKENSDLIKSLEICCEVERRKAIAMNKEAERLANYDRR
jgi:hypothetical protein